MEKKDVLAKIVSVAINHGDAIGSLVRGVRALFGREKSGPEKLEIGAESLAAGMDLYEGLTGVDSINNPEALALYREAVQLGYDIDRDQRRLREIGKAIKHLRARLAVAKPVSPEPELGVTGPVD